MTAIRVGNSTAGSTALNYPSANTVNACRFQNTSGLNGNLTSVTGVWTAANGTAKNKAVIYSDRNGVPNVLLAASAEKVGITVGNNVFSLASGVGVAAGDYLWIGMAGDTTISSPNALNTGAIYWSSATYSSGVPATFPSGYSISPKTYVIYADGTDILTGTTFQLSQLPVEVVRTNLQPPAQLSQLPVEVVRTNLQPPAQLSQLAVEVVRSPVPKLQVAAQVAEVLRTTTTAKLQVAAQLVEVLSFPSPNLQVAAQVVEILRQNGMEVAMAPANNSNFFLLF